jgi:hypothetical protein
MARIMGDKTEKAGWGGKRVGAGRKPGRTPSKRARSYVDRGYELPLDYLMRRANDPSVASPYRDVLMQWCLPYLHARPAQRVQLRTVFELNDSELDELVDRTISYPRLVQRS